MSFWCAIAAAWPHRSPKGHGKQKPAPRGAIKAREATAKRPGLDGEHGDDIAAVAENAENTSDYASQLELAPLPRIIARATPRSAAAPDSKSDAPP
jgi:hypothetical protein